MKRWKRWSPVLVFVLLLMIFWLAWGNRALTVTEIRVIDQELPEAFRGFRIAQVSDLHNAQFGEGNRELLVKLQQLEPDIIVITGDLIDRRRTDVEVALSFAREALKIAPCYFATGNHDAVSDAYPYLEEGLLKLGVTVLRSQATVLEREGESLRLAGAEDYTAFDAPAGEGQVAKMLEALAPVLEPGYNIVLFHRPELAGRMSELDADLILSGHAHGGQFRLPLVGGVYAPDQGFFPDYDEGLYDLGDRFLVVSRGLGNSLFPLRINNRPEIVSITLDKPESSES